MYRKFFKRLIDIICSFTGLVVLAIPMFIIAILIKCDSKGPAIYKSKRAGKNCVPFTFYKFRSMSVDAPKDVATKDIDGAVYITKIGSFIRKTSLDELPQLWNIFTGKMSIIGPRPTVLTERVLIEAREKYGANAVRPGLTGWAQVNGRDVLAQNSELKALYDGEYVKKITFKQDLKIIWLTVKKVLSGDGVVEGEHLNKSPLEEANNASASSEAVIAADIISDKVISNNEKVIDGNIVVDYENVEILDNLSADEINFSQSDENFVIDVCDEEILSNETSEKDDLTAQNILKAQLNNIVSDTNNTDTKSS